MLAVLYILAYFALVFDSPKPERLAYGNEFVLFADKPEQMLFRLFVFGVTRNYTVNERIAIVIPLVVPLFESLGKLP